jgi:hypothetical protein
MCVSDLLTQDIANYFNYFKVDLRYLLAIWCLGYDRRRIEVIRRIGKHF